MLALMKRPVRILGLLALHPAVACYSYHTIPVDDVRPDVEVRLRVTPAAAPRVSAVMGFPTEAVEGTVVQLQDSVVLLQVPAPMPADGTAGPQLYQRLDVPVAQVLQVQRRRLNPVKTYGLIALGLAAGGILAARAFGAIGAGSGTGKGGINNRLVVPLGHLRLGP